MNLVDILLAILVLVGAAGGYRRGALFATAELLALASSVTFAFLAYPYGAALLEKSPWPLGVWTPPLAFFVALVLGRLVFGFAFVRLAKTVPASGHAHVANRALGVLPGTLNGLILATVGAMFLIAVPLNDDASKVTEESVLANSLAAPADWFQAKLQPIFDPAIKRTLTRLTVDPESRETVRLPFTVMNGKPRPDLEAAMLALVNEERVAQGLRALEADPEATPVARAHSVDMLERGYFSHLTPEGADPFDRMQAAKLRFRVAGENLALARTLKMAHQGLMNSPGHRANILQPRFGHVGIGIIDAGRYGLMVTQAFRN